MLKNLELPKCTICGKILIAEVMKYRDKQRITGNLDIDFAPKSDRVDSRQMGKKLQSLGDDDLFGELEPFDLEGDNRSLIEEEIQGKPKSDEPEEEKVNAVPPKKVDDLDDELLDDEAPVFKNPMETSNLMKKLKEDHDLFESLDK